MKSIFSTGLLALGLCCLPSLASAAEVKNSSGGFLDFNFYPYLSDVDNDNVFTLNIAASLPNRFSYFSLTNIGNQPEDNEFSDTTTYYTEQNLRWKVTDTAPIDLTVQGNMRSGEDNDRLRLGFRWRLNDTAFLSPFFKAINLSYSINFHAVQIDDVEADVWQMEHVFAMAFPYLTDRLYLAGFIDHTFNEDLPDEVPSDPAVAEVQLGLRLVENFYAIAEWRLNQYRRSDVNNLALGVEYKIKW
ncbi:hypothetical protein [Spongiibacter sp.]|uniref:hypothetical protein n=1 Tax=Spongiibacter sp. TaxID=2024860 RepID=UPI00257E1D8C|nr:hypothetical protein [Spongiibacter sp.]